jgi:hypothetical protein
MGVFSPFPYEILGPILGVLALIFGIQWIQDSKQRLPFPPGPPGEFLLGHLRVIPKENTAETYARWGKEYSSSRRPMALLQILTAALCRV